MAPCGHSFCSNCISAYLGYSPTPKRSRLDSPRLDSPRQAPTPKPCPVCQTPLAQATVYPNNALASLVDRARAHPTSNNTYGPSPSPDLDLRRVPDSQVDHLLSQLLERKRNLSKDRRAIGVDIIIPFLEKCHADTNNALHTINDDLCLIQADLQLLRKSPHSSSSDSTSNPLPPAHHPMPSPEIATRNHIISQYYQNVKSMYFHHRRSMGHHALPHIIDTLVDATSLSTAKKCATIQHIDILRSNHNLISSIQFNAQSDLFATAGVTKRIKIFDFNAIIQSSSSSSTSTNNHHFPILDIPTQSKISCLSWNPHHLPILAASTYNGHILIHNTQTNTSLHSIQAHSQRAWYVDYSSQKPSLLLSASDDKTVKLWDLHNHPSTPTTTLQTSANVCCAKFNPFEPNQFAYGSADHNVYSHDLRQPKTPLCVFEGHWRAVSHLLFLNRSELVSASTDSSCKLWNVEKQQPGLSYAGHSNDRNFVGLCGSKDFFACGSEDNSVYVYQKRFTGPVVRYPFQSGGAFVSSVAWKPHSKWLVAASNAGSVEIFQLS